MKDKNVKIKININIRFNFDVRTEYKIDLKNRVCL